MKIVQLYHRSAVRVSSELAVIQILCYLALVMSPGGFTERRTFPRNAGPAPHFWETDWQPTAIRGGFKRDDITEASLSQNCGPGPHFWETAPPLKNGQIRGQKHLEQPPKFFLQLPNIYKIYILQKNWSESANPALSSGPNISLPLIWGSHHQLDDQYKEPMVNTEII